MPQGATLSEKLWGAPKRTCCRQPNSSISVIKLLGDSGGVVNSLDFCPSSLKPLGCFYFRCFFFLSTNSRSFDQPQNDAKTLFFPTLHPLSTVIFATATVLAFVLLRSSNFNCHCYTQREATPTQKSARKCAATSRDFFRERLQSAFTLANQLR